MISILSIEIQDFRVSRILQKLCASAFFGIQAIDTARLVVQEIDVVCSPCLSDQLPVRIVVIVGRECLI